MSGALIFLALVVGWALLLGRLMGGTGTWLPTGGSHLPPADRP